MKCEETLALLDQYVKGDLDDRAAYRLTSHLAECEECTQAYELIQREQQVYSRFLLDVEASPRLWANVRKGIELEDVWRQRKPVAWLGALSQRLFMQRAPLFAAITVIVAVGIFSFAVMKFQQSNTGVNNAQLADNAKNSQLVGAPRPPDTPRALENSVAPGPKQQNAVRRFKLSKNQGRVLVAARTASDDMGTWLKKLKASSDTEEKFIPASSFITTGWDSDAAQHAQKAEVVLRSFRNIAARPGADVSYEKRQSRELIARNILLRREAQTTGDVATEELLSRLEPILIDIANLPQKTSSRDVWQIQEQMRRDGIVSALHFRQTSQVF